MHLHVDSNGKGYHGRGKAKNHRSQSSVESEETKDYVREAKGMDQEDVEELSFVPSAISVPQKIKFRCDNQHLAVGVGGD